MNHGSLVDLILRVNTAAAAGSIGIYYHFEKKIPSTYGISKEFDDAVLGLRRTLMKELSDLLSPVFENLPVSISATLENYSEKASSPVGTEPYRTALSQFIEDHIDTIKDYRTIKCHCNRHRTWLNRIVWLSVALFFIAAAATIGIYLFEKVFQIQMSNVFLLTLLGTPIAICATILICDGVRRYNSHQAMELRSKYETL